ncbi:pksn polyketide synthase for alternapyrone biosynthesis [Colletotrichum truncatum]|uniref:Pksn polyketide synthase for alternapyrone biosynthesis n=1 Tax=Colletotrichum truncatum TaxID=5467 RepID=A0ACC3YNX6_COLTU|nr:pksn polyketide synthase for alternapyrone biosynthesis [Colletotrichum truncatum]KAF6789506.1 pksn polyketide synthase for alternapyrone biosynthesis [Colletotrichum truncatum]
MSQHREQEPIAIIGAACRLSGEATSLGRLWDMISHGRNAHGKVPASRWDADAWYHPDPDRKGSISVTHGYFLEQDVSLFDAPFFSMTAKEAAGMDPMKRMLLEVSYEGFENAGIPVDTLMNSQTGVYVGCMTSDYEQLSTHDIYDVGDVAASGMSEAMIANRVSWFFGLKGPSLTLDTACSSSLYALHLACQSLKLRETNMGLVAGVNLVLHPNFMHQLSSMHMLSPEGISHSFDYRANGYGRGEGIGCLIVKRLEDALRDGDTIRAIIRGTGTNADGKTPGITQPSPEAQAQLIKSTYEAAGLSFSDTQYFEAHGTGTPLGDPVELSAIGATLGVGRRAECGPLYIGSIKANVGHTEGCSGLAGVLKSILCLEKGILVPTAGVEKLNPKLKLSEWNLALPSENMAWPSKGQRRISVNSFGFGGANAHVILDDAYNYMRIRGLLGNHATRTFEDDSSESGISIGSDSPRQDVNKRLFAFSSRDQNGIERLSPLYNEFLSNKEATSSTRFLADLAHTLSGRRTHFEYRTFAIAESVLDLQNQMSKGLPKLKRGSKHDNPIFVFTGQGAQWPSMGVQLLNNCIFRTSLHKSQVLLEHYGCSWDLIDELSKTADSNVDLPQYSQVLCTVLQIGLVDLLRAWGVTPKAVVGHSSGEIGAAYAAGLLSRCNAVKVAYLRGVCSAKVADMVSPRKGAMLAAGISEEESAAYLKRVPSGSVVVACVNSPSSVTLSGDIDHISTLCDLINSDGKFARLLKVKTAYHSPHMATVAQEYMDRMGVIIPLADEDQIAPMFSSLTGDLVTSRDLDGAYWMRNMCEQVGFSKAMSNLLNYVPSSLQGRGRNRTPWSSFIEIGPHGALQSPVKEIVKASQSKAAKDASYLSAITRGKDAETTILELAGKLWVSGHSIDLQRVNGIIPESLPVSLPDLPPYPWNHGKQYWHESMTARSNRFPSGPWTDLLGVPVALQNPMEPRWHNYLRISENPWIEDHKITGTTLYPAAGMIVMAIEAAIQLKEPSRTIKGITFSDLKFERGLVVPSRDQAVKTEISMRPDNTQNHTWLFTVFSTITAGTWTKHCHGSLTLEYDGEDSKGLISSKTWNDLAPDWKETESQISKNVDMDDFYDDLESIGVEYGPSFRNVRQATAIVGEHSVFGSISIPDTLSIMPYNFEFPHLIHPATMDAIFHLLFIAFSDGKPLAEAAVPYTLKQMYISTDLPQGHGSIFTGYAKLIRTDGRETSGDLIVSDESRVCPKIVVHDFALRQVTSSQEFSVSRDDAAQKVCANVRWKEDVDSTASDLLSDFQTTHTANCGFESNEKVSYALLELMNRMGHKKPNYDTVLFVASATETSRSMLQGIFRMLGTGQKTGIRAPSKFLIIAMTLEAKSLVETISTAHEALIDVKTWDPQSKEPSPFSEQQFDIVLGVDTSYQTICNSSILSHLYETVRPNGFIGMIHPLANTALRDNVLELLRSFGLEFKITVMDESAEQSMVLASKPLIKSTRSIPEQVVILHGSQPTLQAQTMEMNLANRLRALGCDIYVATLETFHDFHGKHIISLLEVDKPFVYQWSKEQFANFKRLISNANHLLWISRGGVLQNWEGGLEFAPSQGLLRVMRTEYPHIILPHLDLSRTSDISSETTINNVLNVWTSSFYEQQVSLEMEYAELDGSLFIPRFTEDEDIDTDLSSHNQNLKPIRGPLDNKVPRMLAQEDEGLVWVTDDKILQPLGRREVEICVEYATIKQSAGGSTESQSHPYNVSVVVGVIESISTEVTSLQVGQRVIALQSGPCRNRIRSNEMRIRQLPQDIQPEEAAATLPALIASQYTLLDVVRLESDQTLFIHGAESVIGQVAIQLAHLVGAKVFAVVSGVLDRQLFGKLHGIGQDRIFGSVTRSCRTAVLEMTNGRGADVILNCGPYSSPAECLDCLADFGVFVDLNNGPGSRKLTAEPDRNLTIVKADTFQLLRAKPALSQRLFNKSVDLIEKRKVSPVKAVTVRSISTLEVSGMDNIQESVFRFNENSLVLIRPTRLPELHLDSKATYVIAGGLGALGLQIAEMMFQHGAGHIVFLSRSGGEKSQEVLGDFRNRGLKVDAFKCDVTDASQVEEAVRAVTWQGGLIKGVIQSAMVLEDAIFENMSYEQWQKSTRPKIQGTMNLHDCMPKDVDFFILLSSITCVIGNAAQSNYAAGNTFEDAFAHYRRAHGQAATAIDVGLVTDSAHFLGDFDMDAYLQMYEHRWEGLQTTQRDLDIVLRAAMRGQTANGQAIKPQIVLGLGSNVPSGPSAATWTKDPKFSHRINHRIGATTSMDDGKPVADQITKAESFTDAVSIFEQMLKIYAALAIDVSPDDIDTEKAFYDFGGTFHQYPRAISAAPFIQVHTY